MSTRRSMYKSLRATLSFKLRTGPPGLGHTFDWGGVDDGECLVRKLGQLAEVFKFSGSTDF